MSTGKAQETYTDDSYPYAKAPEPPMRKQTSITVHVMRMASVTMTLAELDALCNVVEQAHINNDYPPATEAIMSEFIHAVDSLR